MADRSRFVTLRDRIDSDQRARRTGLLVKDFVSSAGEAGAMTTLTRRVEQRAVNMAAMMLHLGIWPEASFDGLPMESAIRTCLFCGQADRCSRWLADTEADPSAWQRFCPNAELFAALRRRPVEEMLDDPMIQLVMASDGVRREDLEQLLTGLRAR